MLWTAPRQWAPSLVVTVQSRPCYLIEIGLYCTVALALCVAILTRYWSGGTKASAESTPPLLEGSAGQDAGPDAADDADVLFGGDAGAGDGVGAEQRHWPQPREAPAAAPMAAGLQPQAGTGGVYVACAACQRAHGVAAGPPVPETSSGYLLVEDGVDKDSVDDEISVLSVGDSALSLGDDQSSDTVEECAYSDVSQGPPPQGNMVEYVSARYQGFKKAALARKLLAAGPGATGAALLSEKQNLVVLMSHAPAPSGNAGVVGGNARMEN